MSKYTTELRYIVESGTPIFDFSYPIFDENYRKILEQKIIDTYYFREIGFETFGKFKHYLKTKMNTIMPYYNQLYDSEHLITKDDYWQNMDTVEKHTKTVTQSSKGTSDSQGNSMTSSKNKDVFSDTPQAKLNGLDYATNLTENDGEGSETSVGKVTSEGEATTIEEYEIKMLGGGGMRYNADVLMEWRKSFLNIDKQILDELNELFMGIY